jgi:hypothetical protein
VSYKAVLFSIDADIMFLLVYTVSALKPAHRVAAVIKLLYFDDTAGVFYLMLATFAGMSGFPCLYPLTI